MAILERVSVALKGAKVVLDCLKNGNDIKSLGLEGFGSLKSDTELYADFVLSRYFVKFFQKEHSVRNIMVEGLKDQVCANSSGRFDIYIDPLDGSLNYKTAQDLKKSVGNSTVALPYTSVITVVEWPKTTAYFCNIMGAGIIDFRTGDIVFARKGGQTTLNGIPVHCLNETEVDSGKQILIAENYYPQNRNMMNRAFRDQEGWFRNPGSAAYEMMLVACGISTSFICCSQKMHELGAGYLLVTNAGGCALTFNGDNLQHRRYEFNTRTPVILACTEKYGQNLVKMLA
jgi:3'-phosphoadenosine 5'-phosphosulfate (PAPS) 3'-phosphatase